MKIKSTTLTVSVHREGTNPIFGEGVTHVSVEDEAAGGFIVIEQLDEQPDKKLRFDEDELGVIMEVAKKLIADYDKANLPPVPEGM